MKKSEIQFLKNGAYCRGNRDLNIKVIEKGRNLSSFVALFMILMFSTSLIGQNKCGQRDFHFQQLQDPGFQKSYDQTMHEIYKIENKWKKENLQKTDGTNCNGGLKYIPVAIHYELTGLTEAMKTCLIQEAKDQIVELNKAYSGAACTGTTNSFDSSSGGCFEFKIANMGHPAVGDNVGGESLAITFNQDYCPNDGNNSFNPCYISAWGGFMNFVIRGDDAGGTLGVTGLGPKPNGGNANGNVNAILVGRCAWGTGSDCFSGANCDQNLRGGATAIHEAGHFLNLRHVFCAQNSQVGANVNNNGGGLPASTNCTMTQTFANGTFCVDANGNAVNVNNRCENETICAMGCLAGATLTANPVITNTDNVCDCDELADTPPQAFAEFGNTGCSMGTNSLTANPTTGQNKLYNNYMDYVNDECMHCFTADQAMRMSAHFTSLTNDGSGNGYKTKAQTCLELDQAPLPPMVSVTDPCNCNDPMNVTAANGDIQYFHDVLTFSGNAGSAVSCIVNCGVFLTNTGANLSISGTIPASGTLTIDFWRAPGDYTASTFQVGSLEAVLSGGTCDATPCNNVVTANPIPTVGEWGLIVLALSMMIVGVLFMSIRSVSPKKG